MFKQKITVTLAALLALAGCGGGSSDSSSAGAVFASAFAMSFWDCQSNRTAANGIPLVANTLLFADGGVGYRTCNDQLWVGQVSVTQATSSAGNAVAKFSIYQNGKGLVGSSPNLSGAITINANGYVSLIDLRDASAGPAFQGSITDALADSIAGSYATLSGSYNSDDLKETLTIGGDGALTGSTEFGSLNGKITRLRSDTHVHNVTFTLTPTSGAPVSFEGVLGPQTSAIILSGTGGNQGYTKVFYHK